MYYNPFCKYVFTEVIPKMKKTMRCISVISVFLTIISIFLYCFWEVAVAKSFAITFGTTAYHFLMRLTVGVAFNLFMKNRADYTGGWYQCRNWETKLYKWLRVKQWKSKLPSYQADYFDPKKHSWHEIAQAMCQAELVHEVIIVLSFVPILLSCWFGEFLVFLITSLGAASFYMLFVMIQRYNRPRILKLINR